MHCIHPHWGEPIILALQAQASFRETQNAIKGLLAYLPLIPTNAPSRNIPTNVPSHVLGSIAQAHRHDTQNTQFALHDWDADLTQIDVKQSEILYSPGITFGPAGF